ncbi:DMT family transporter [Agrilactobacillus yilanensis]|uniref:DMT family transporter n=1 Tax=Agrilactobacillus yilanensis TaxID=2485997 RepID=A0ABW4J761_9LACO|nr:DMT family transporter [Agrilactobacillus yilanensis]
MFLFAIPVLMGLTVATQTAVNSRLGKYTKTPFMASAISFSVGALFLLILMVATKTPILIPLTTFAHNPWWLWIVGFTGAFGLTVNILLFPRLGSVQTAVLPIFGQILAGTLVDQFGLFYSPISQITPLKLLGLVLVLLGMLAAVALGNKNKLTTTTNRNGSQIFWQLLGIFAGLVIGFQTAINGRLGTVLHSPIKATFVAFLIGAITLSLITMFLGTPVKERFHSIGHGLSKGEWWILLGGICGSLYIFFSAWLVPLIGTGQVIVIALFGQLLFSAVIDQLGMFHAVKRSMSLIKVIGLIVMLAGVVIIRFMA